MDNFFYGLVLAASMIMAIGAQNLHVIRQGLVKKYVFSVAMTCFVCDFLLMSFGVFFVGSLSDISPKFEAIITGLAILFLLVYGFLAFQRGKLATGGMLTKIDSFNMSKSRTHAILTTLAMSLLNPHVYLDTVMVVGGFAANLIFIDKISFISGALCASFLWFFGLAYATPYLLARLKTPKSATYFDYFVAAVMWILAFKLAYDFLYAT